MDVGVQVERIVSDDHGLSPTGNERIAAWMNAPESQFLLKFVRPGISVIKLFVITDAYDK
jgi:hypothetical protein